MGAESPGRSEPTITTTTPNIQANLRIVRRGKSYDNISGRGGSKAQSVDVPTPKIASVRSRHLIRTFSERERYTRERWSVKLMRLISILFALLCSNASAGL